MPKIVEDEQIYQAVIQVVSERGYASATTKQMADAADVSEVTLFRKFETKAQLVKQAISFVIEQTDFSVAARYSGDVHADLLRITQAYQNSAVKHGYFFTALFSEVSQHPELIDSLDGPLNIFQTVSDLITRYQAEGILQPEHPSLTVAALLGPLMYISLMPGAVMGNQVPNVDLSQHITRFLAGRSA